MSQATEVTEDTFTSEVLDSELPVLVDFWASWCGPCRAIAPVLDQIAEEYSGRLRVVKVNIDENPNIAAQYRITSIPALKVFQRGSEVLEMLGAQPKHTIEQQLKPVLG